MIHHKCRGVTVQINEKRQFLPVPDSLKPMSKIQFEKGQLGGVFALETRIPDVLGPLLKVLIREEVKM